MKALAAFAFIIGIAISLVGFFESEADQILLYVVASFSCYICAGVFMLVDKK